MTDPSWRKLLSLAIIVLLVVAWGGIRLILSLRFVISNHHLSLLIDVPPWLGIGGVMRNVIHPHSRAKLQEWKDFFVALILAWGLMGLFWFLPFVFPSSQTNAHGIEINLLNSPIVLLISMAFWLGFFIQVFVKLFPCARKQTSASLVAFFRGVSEVLSKTFWSV